MSSFFFIAFPLIVKGSPAVYFYYRTIAGTASTQELSIGTNEYKGAARPNTVGP
jgi:hypothetical protein